MRARLLALALALPSSTACYISSGADAGPPCATEACGCYVPTRMVFTGQVMDGVTGTCLRGKLVRLRDRDGTVKAEDTSRTAGTYRLEGDVDQSPNCPGGEPVVRDDPVPGQALPTYGYLPRRHPSGGAGSAELDLLRVPYGTVDAGTGAPALCTPAPVDGGA
jgi:hypothetical protein